MTYVRLSAFVLGLTVAAGSAHAAPTVTTGALGAFGTNRLACTATNVSSKDIEVTLEIINQVGAVLVSLSFTIPPGEVEGGGTVVAPTQGFCRVTGASKRNVRVALCVTDSTLNCLAAVSGE